MRGNAVPRISAALILPPSLLVRSSDSANKRHAPRFLHGSLTLLIEAALGKHFMFIDIPVPTPRPRSASVVAPLLQIHLSSPPALRCARRQGEARPLCPNHCLVPHRIAGCPPGLPLESREISQHERESRKRAPQSRGRGWERFFLGER